jgi:hypothetical protein
MFVASDAIRNRNELGVGEAKARIGATTQTIQRPALAGMILQPFISCFNFSLCQVEINL